jgi:hypothetical protein
VEVVAAVVGGQQPKRVGRIPDRLVEVDDAVEGAAGADPVVDGFAFGFPGGGVVPGILEGSARGAFMVPTVPVFATMPGGTRIAEISRWVGGGRLPYAGLAA